MKRKTYQGRPTYQNRGYKKRRTGSNTYKRIPYRRFTPRTMGPLAASESKYVDSAISATAIAEGTTWAGTELDPTGGPTNTLFAPPQGTGFNERIGRRVAISKIAIRGTISTVALTDQADIVSSPATRIIVYMDKQTNGVQSQGEELMAIGPSATGNYTPSVESAFNSFQNINNFGRFVVLKDVIYTPRIVTSGTDGTNTNSQNVSQICFKMNIKFKTPVLVRFDASSADGNIADIVDNSFHLIATKSGTAFASTLQYVCRSYFKDA